MESLNLVLWITFDYPGKTFEVIPMSGRMKKHCTLLYKHRHCSNRSLVSAYLKENILTRFSVTRLHK